MGGGKNYLPRIFKLYAVWAIILFVSDCLFSGACTCEKVGNMLYSFVFRGYSVLWYLWGLLVVLPILKFLSRIGRKHAWILIVLGFGAYLFNKAYTHYGSMDAPGFPWQWSVWLYDGNYFGVTNFCLAFTFLAFGSYFAITERKLKVWQCLLLILIGAIEMHFETYKGVALGKPLIAIGIFQWVKNWNLRIPVDVAKWLRHASTLVYFLHIIVISAVGLFMDGMNWVKWGVIVACTVAISALLLWLRRYKAFSFINQLM